MQIFLVQRTKLVRLVELIEVEAADAEEAEIKVAEYHDDSATEEIIEESTELVAAGHPAEVLA